MHKYSVSLSFYIMLSLFFSPILTTLTKLVVTVNDTLINANSSHTWQITYNRSITRTNFTLNFPTCVSLSSDTVVFNSLSVPQTLISYNSTSISFGLSTPVAAAKNYTFVVQNVKNCYYADGQRNFTVWNDNDGVVSGNNMAYVAYTPGTILGCSLQFAGKTGDTNSTLSIPFKIRNQVYGASLRLQLRYPTYFSSSQSLTSYAGTHTPTCALSINNTLQSPTNTTAAITSQLIICVFAISSLAINAQPTSYDSIILYINSINNPVTHSRYALNTDFVLTTQDTDAPTNHRYDISSTCDPGAVLLSEYNGRFSYSEFINTRMIRVKMTTVEAINLRFNANDQILIAYPHGTFSSCSNTFLAYKGTFAPTTCTQQVSNTQNTLLYKADNDASTQANSTLTIQYTNCYYLMPVSAMPYTITLTFSGTNSANLIYDNYMKVNLLVTPQPTPMQKVQANLSLSMRTIGDISAYTFNILTKQPLSENPRITIQFPSDIGIAYMSTCDVSINSSGVGSRSCAYVAPNTIQINITTLVPIPSNSSLSISLNNLTNPSSPTTPITGFIITTYYSSQIATSTVQIGNNIIDPLLFSARTIHPVIVPSSASPFAVYTAGTQMLIKYVVGVKIPSSSTTTLSFTTILQSLSYIDVTATPSLSPAITKSSNNATTYVFSLPQVQPNTQVEFRYSCTTPMATGIYSIVNITTAYGSIEYEKTATQTTITITQPHSNTFFVNPTLAVTGETTSYTVSFTSTVPYTGMFVLEMVFPTGTNFNNGISLCSTGCAANTTLLDTSSGPMDRIQVTMPANAGTYAYSFVLTSITNQRQVTTSPDFIFTTYTPTTRYKILSGTGKATISTANLLAAALVASDDYYHSNTSPVHITVSVKNKLQYGDLIQFQFTSDTYSLSSATLTTSQGTCTFSQASASSPLYVRVYPSASQVVTSSISIQIQGLVSGGASVYGVFYPIGVVSYSSLNNKMDKGTMQYSVDCGQTPAVIGLQCKTCTIWLGTYVCTSCYSGMNLFNNSKCINNCGDLSKYQTFNNSGVCVSCVQPCYYCNDATNCRECIAEYYLIDGTTQCQPRCNTSNGYYAYNYTYNNRTFMRCKKCTDQYCISCPTGALCEACVADKVLLNGACEGGCIDGTYSSQGKCLPCDTACVTCAGATNTDCIACNVGGGYLNFSGVCTNKCPDGTVNLTSGCGCAPQCGSCVDISTKCLLCADVSKYRYNYTCYDTCPTATYPLGQECISCRSGCLRCTNTTCMQCDNSYNIYENMCYSNCKEVGPRFTSMLVDGIYKCVQCPDGCSDCELNYTCTKCLADYVQNGTICIRACSLTNSCDIQTKPETIVPLPGFITFAIYCAIVAVLKLFVIKGMYAPYALLFGGALVEFALTAASLGAVDVKLKSITTVATRLLQSTTSQAVPAYLLTALGLLACSLALNYILNALFVVLFCKYYRQMLLQRQIDIISNYAVLVFGSLTSYRFYLLAFSRFFKQPYIQVSEPQKLKPLNIILGISYILDLLTLVAGFVLVTNATQLSILYMLGIDLILIIFILWIVFLWVLLRPKPEDYYTQTKKYFFQEQYATEENSIHNGTKINQKEISKAKLTNLTNQKLFVQDYNGENNIDNLPTLQPNALKVVPKQTEKIEQFQQVNPRTKRKQKTGSNTFSSEKKFFKSGLKQGDERTGTLQQAAYQTLQNQSAPNKKKVTDNKASYRSQTQFQNISNDPNQQNIMNEKNKNRVKVHERNQSQSVIQKQKKPIQQKKEEQVFDFQQDKQSDIHEQQIKQEEENPNQQGYKKQKKYKPQNQRSSTLKVGSQSVAGMKKKKVYGNLQSEAAESNLDEVDLESIIQTKMIDRSKQKQNKGQLQKAQTEIGKDDETNHYQQISPSWFNLQNQRYDIDDKSLQ